MEWFIKSNCIGDLLDAQVGVKKQALGFQKEPILDHFFSTLSRYGLYREDVLDAYLFKHVDQVNTQSENWKRDYNNNHPHKSLGYRSPIRFMKERKLLTVENSANYSTIEQQYDDD